DESEKDWLMLRQAHINVERLIDGGAALASVLPLQGRRFRLGFAAGLGRTEIGTSKYANADAAAGSANCSIRASSSRREHLNRARSVSRPKVVKCVDLRFTTSRDSARYLSQWKS